MLLNIIGKECRELYKSFEYETGEGHADDKYKYDIVVKKFEDHCIPRTSKFVKREQLYKMKQKPDQTVDQFISEIRNQVRECGLAEDPHKDDIIRDRLRVGISDRKCQEKLVNKGDDLTLEDAIKTARNYEATRKELQDLVGAVGGSEQTTDQVHAVKKKFQRRPDGKSDKKKDVKKFDCGRCGYKHEAKKCPAYGKDCMKCV